MSFGSVQRYIDGQFTCVNCHNVNKIRIDTLKDLYHKGRNPPIQGNHRRSYYYGRNCTYCGTYNEVQWQ